MREIKEERSRDLLRYCKNTDIVPFKVTKDIIVWYCNIAFKIQKTAAANECNSNKLTKSLEGAYEKVLIHLRSENHTVNPKEPQRGE